MFSLFKKYYCSSTFSNFLPFPNERIEQVGWCSRFLSTLKILEFYNFKGERERICRWFSTGLWEKQFLSRNSECGLKCPLCPCGHLPRCSNALFHSHVARVKCDHCVVLRKAPERGKSCRWWSSLASGLVFASCLRARLQGMIQTPKTSLGTVHGPHKVT